MTSANDDLETLFAISQSQGTRPYQEDEAGYQAASGADDLPSVIVLADGMGGHAGGKQASNLAVRKFLDAFAKAQEATVAEKLQSALHKANASIAKAISAEPELSGMGCTLVGGAITKDGFEWVSVGDSPLFKLGANGLERLNADHSMAPLLADMVARGELTEEKARRDPRRNSLRSAVTGNELELIDASSAPIPFRDGELLLFASDGLESLSTDEMMAILRDSPDHAGAMAKRLVDEVDALGRKSQDNTTVIIARRPGSRIAAGKATAFSEADTVAPPKRPVTAAPRKNQIVRIGLAVLAALALLFAVKLLLSTDAGDNTEQTPEPSLTQQSDTASDTESARTGENEMIGKEEPSSAPISDNDPDEGQTIDIDPNTADAPSPSTVESIAGATSEEQLNQNIEPDNLEPDAVGADAPQ